MSIKDCSKVDISFLFLAHKKLPLCRHSVVLPHNEKPMTKISMRCYLIVMTLRPRSADVSSIRACGSCLLNTWKHLLMAFCMTTSLLASYSNMFITKSSSCPSYSKEYGIQ